MRNLIDKCIKQRCKRLFVCFALVIQYSVLVANVSADISDAEFPKGWEKWPIVKKGSIPAKSVPVPKDVPESLQQFVSTYNWINDEKGTIYSIRHNTEVLGKKGFKKDGFIAVIEFPTLELIFVSETFSGDMLFGVYGFDGLDKVSVHKSQKMEFCKACHAWYKYSECPKGVCSNK